MVTGHNGGAFEFSTPKVVAESFQEGLVILNLDSGKYFDAGERLVPLLEALTTGTSLASLTSGLDALEAGVASDVEQAIEKLLEFGLIRETQSQTKQADGDICATILAAGQSFFLESHDDLADLIAADPIHDIDPITGRLTK
nr:hypothetical protein [uncultured Shimia sp.]